MAFSVLGKFTFIKCLRHNFLFTNQCALFSTQISEIFIRKPAGDKTTVKGWVKSLRKMKENIFIDLDDGSCSKRIQVFCPKSLMPQNLSYGSAVTAKGELQITRKGQLELVANEVEVVGPCVVMDGYPFVPKQTYAPEYLRQYLHLRSRTSAFAAMLRVRDAATQSFNSHFHNNGYTSIHSPVLTSNDCEGAGEVFSVRPDNEDVIKLMAKEGSSPAEAYFDSKAYLTVSGQMHLETVVRSLSKVYTFGPTFRAENSKSRLHLSEFYMLEAEIAFLDNLESLLVIMEAMVKDVTNVLLDKCEDDIDVLHKTNKMDKSTVIEMTKQPFGILTYDEAVDILNKHSINFSSPVVYGEGLGKEHELFLVQHNDNVPVFVVNWPSGSKPFYMKAKNNDSSKVSAVDLLVPAVGELCGGSLREDNYDVLSDRLRKSGLKKSLAWYLELRKFGNVPTGGFGMGFERYLQLILGIPNIKDAIPFPRWAHNCKL